MAGKSDIEAGKAYITLYVKNSQLVKGLEAVGQQLKTVGTSIMGFGARVTAVGAGIITAFAGATAVFVNMGSELADVSARTGVAVGSLAELKFAAEQTGATFEDVERAIRKMQQNGFSADQFDEIAQSIASIEDPAKRTEKAMEVFGKGGAALIPLMGNLAELRQQAQELGLVPTEQAVADADTIGDLFDQIASVGRAAIFEIGAALSPILIPALEAVRGIAVATSRWVRENAALVRTIALVGVGIFAAGVAITAIGALVFGIGVAFTAVAAIITGIASAVAFLLSPLGAVIGLLTAGVAMWATMSEGGRAAVSGIAEDFMSLGEVFTDTWGGVVDALASGDLELAGRVALAGLMLAWTTATQSINKLWEDAKWYFMATWQEATAYLGKIFINIWAGLQSGFVSAVSLMRSTWGEFTRFLADSQTVLEGQADTLQTNVAEAMGLVSAEDAADARKFIENRTLREIGDRDAQNRADQAAIEKSKNEELARIEADRVGANSILEQDKQRQRNALNAQYQADLDAKQADVDKARKELMDARGQAGRQAGLRDREGFRAPGVPGMGGFGTNSPLVTFSAAGLLAAGGTGGPMRVAQEHLAVGRQQLEQGKKAAQQLQAIERKIAPMEFVA